MSTAQVSYSDEPLKVMDEMRIIAITRDARYDLFVSRVPSIGEHILIGDLNYVVKTVQHLPNATQVVANVWVVQSPHPAISS